MIDNFDKLYGFHGDRVQFGTMTGAKFSYRIPYSSYSSIYQPRNIMIATPEELNPPAPTSPQQQEDKKPEEKLSSSKQTSLSISPIMVGSAGAIIGGIIAHATKQNVLIGVLIGAGTFAGASMLISKQ